MILRHLRPQLLLTRSYSTLIASREMVAPRLLAAELLKKRKEDRERTKKTILNTADIQVLGSNCQGHQPSLLINSEGRAYLFNCGEGTQRNCYTNKIKLVNLEHLFLTNLDWQKLSGTYGLSLTLQDLGIPSFTLHGPEGLSDFFKSVSTFLSFNTGIDCRTKICHDGYEYKDSSISIKSVILDTVSNKNPDHEAAKKPKRESRLISYVCRLPDMPGSLDPQKCREFGVPIGPKLAILKSGCDITLDDGRVVTSTDVCGPKNRGLKLLVVDCPSIGDIQSVIENCSLEEQRRLRLSSHGDQIGLVVHFSPEDVFSDQKYKSWIEGFPSECRHIMLANSQPNWPNLLDIYRLQYLLQHLDKDLFPSLSLPDCHNRRIQQELSEKTDLEYGQADPDELELKYSQGGAIADLEKVYRASALDKFVIRPIESTFMIENRLSIDGILKSAALLPDFEEDYESYQAWMKTQPEPAPHEPEVVFLGTGSALPSKLRNTSCIIVNTNVPERLSLILDCGEDSYGQMVRFYGEQGAREFLRHVSLIYISHHHADHHIGLVTILRQLKMLQRPEPVILLIPPGLELQLDYYNNNFEDLRSVYHITSTRSLKTKSPQAGSSANTMADSINDFIRAKSRNVIQSIKLVAVEHCVNSCAVSIELNIGHPDMKTFKISYSGDARPSEDFAIIGRDSDLLIHEATFDSREQNSAIEKKHSTTTEAIKVSKRMRAKYTILTHFSQRYPKIPYFTSDFDDTIGYAFDNMALRCPTHYPRLPRMKKIFSTVFSKSLNEIDAKYAKMMSRQEAISRYLNQEASKS